MPRSDDLYTKQLVSKVPHYDLVVFLSVNPHVPMYVHVCVFTGSLIMARVLLS